MNRELDNYVPRINPREEDIPIGYRPCEHLGNEALIALSGKAITCTANCPYGNQNGGSVDWEAEEKERRLCHTKGLKLESRSCYRVE